MATTSISSIQFKRGSASALEAWTAIPQVGEPIYDTTNKKLKIGDGIHCWKDLAYIGGGGSEAEQVVFGSYLEFPNVGEVNKLYVAKDKRMSYLWDETNLCYKPVAIEETVAGSREVDGGSASTTF